MYHVSHCDIPPPWTDNGSKLGEENSGEDGGVGSGSAAKREESGRKLIRERHRLRICGPTGLVKKSAAMLLVGQYGTEKMRSIM